MQEPLALWSTKFCTLCARLTQTLLFPRFCVTRSLHICLINSIDYLETTSGSGCSNCLLSIGGGEHGVSEVSRGLESASEKRSTMSSQETPGASSSRGTAIRLEATTGTGNPVNQIEDVGIALGQPTAGDFKLEFFQEIDDPKGDYKVQVLGCGAPQHDLPNPPVPDLDSDLYMKIVSEIIDKFYENRFQQLEDDLEDY